MLNSLSNVSVQQLKRVIAVREKIEALEQKLAQILGSSDTTSTLSAAVKPKRRKMSAAARAKIGAAQKLRWAKQKKGAPAAKKGRRKMSAAARAKIAAAARARWAAVKAANRKTLAKA